MNVLYVCTDPSLSESACMFPAAFVSGVDCRAVNRGPGVVCSFSRAQQLQCADEMLFTRRSEGEMLILPFHPPDTINQRPECCRC